MSRVAVGSAIRRGEVLPLDVHRSGRTITFEVDGRPTYRVECKSAALAAKLETRFVWWLGARDWPSFDALHEHVVAEYDRARSCAARMQRGSVFRTEAYGGVGTMRR